MQRMIHPFNGRQSLRRPAWLGGGLKRPRLLHPAALSKDLRRGAAGDRSSGGSGWDMDETRGGLVLLVSTRYYMNIYIYITYTYIVQHYTRFSSSVF